MRLARHSLAIVLAIACAASLSCKVNDYCLNCATGDGGNGDGAGDGNGDGGGDGGGTDGGGPCIPTGTEVCDNKDNDCDGFVDNGPLPQVGDPCAEQRGECAGGVKQCSPTGTIVCSKNPKPEQCNLKDDDCDGVVDNGDPSDALHQSGAKCGTNAGECTAGTFHCNVTTGVVTCGLNCGTPQAFDCAIGGENPPFGTGLDTSCNARDDNCNGLFDEDVPAGGLCGGSTVSPAFNVAPSICRQGNFQCVGGGTVCIGSIEAQAFELCDSLDNDCDGQVDEDFNFNTDPLNCGSCGAVCTLDHAFEGCADPDGNGPLGPACTVVACEAGFHNNDGQAPNGCEFGPCTITGSVEVCNGVDDDCNPATGNNGPPPGNLVETGLTPPVGFTCLQQGECAGAVPVCTGVGGFKCSYGATVSQDANGNVVAETLCDGRDNDCDGAVDENQPNVGDVCLETGQQGICQGSGAFQCDTANLNGPAICVITTPGGASKPEECNNLDDDCDGAVDNGANTGNLVGQEWVNIPGLPGVQIMKYEASRRDSTDTFQGTTSTFACSQQDAQPWTNITYPTAKAVCESMTNGRLCTEAEWQQMCMPTVTYGANGVPGPATAGATDFVFIEAEDFLANTTIGGATRAWTRTAPLNQNGVTFMQVPDNGFNQTVAANAVAQSSRLDYRLDLLGATSYNIWVRMRSPTQGATITPVIRGSTIPTVTLNPLSPASTQVGDLVIVSTWTTATNNTVPTLTAQAGFTEVTITDDYNEGGNNNTGRMSIAFIVATTAGALNYQAFTASHGTSNTGIVVLQAGTFNTATIAATSREDTDTDPADAPNSPNVTVSSLVLAYGGWHINDASTNVTVTAPSNGFTEVWEMAEPAIAEFSVASVTLASGQLDPNAFGDNVGPQGTIGVTVTIGGFTSGSRSMFVGLTAGTGTPGTPQQTITTVVDNQTSWRVAGAITSGAAGAHTLSLFTREDGLFIDTIAIARQGILSPTFDNAWSYETNPRIEQATTCNSDDFDTDGGTGGDQDDNVPTGSKLACFANHTNPDDAFDMSGNVKEWTLARALNQNPLRGGAANNEAAGTTCQLSFTLADDTFFFPNTGFRCCRGP